MTDIRSGPPRFRYLEDAREHAFNQAGSEVIKQKDGEYLVEPMEMPQLPKIEPGEDVTQFLKEAAEQRIHADKYFKAELEKIAQGSSIPVVEFIIDDNANGPKWPDRRFSVNGEGKVEQAKFDVTAESAALKSPLDRGLEILRLAIRQNDVRTLVELTPDQIGALAGCNQLTPPERAYFEEHLGSPEAKRALAEFLKAFEPTASLAASGSQHYSEFVALLNDAGHRANLERLRELARFPESFQSSLAEDESTLIELARTLKVLPGFGRYPVGLPSPDQDKGKLYTDAIQTINRYRFKFKVETGMQFNKQGIAGHTTDLSYRHGTHIWTLGMQGQDYDFSGPGGGFGFQNRVGDARQRFALGYSSGSLDFKLNAARDRQGQFSLERPESQAADRYIGRKKDDMLKWLKENPWVTAGVAGGVLTAAYLYSKAHPDQKLPMEFGWRTTLYENEYMRLRSSLTPELSLKDGQVDLGVKEAGLGLSGNYGRQFYDLNVKQRFENSSIRSENLASTGTEVNARYGIGSHSLMLDTHFNYDNSVLSNQLAYRKEFVHAPGFRTYVQPYVRTQETSYATAGMLGGLHRDFGANKSFSMDLNLGYDHKGGVSGGFGIKKEF